MTHDEKYPQAAKVRSLEARKKQAFLQDLFEWFDEQKDEIGIAVRYAYSALGDDTHQLLRGDREREQFIARYCGIDWEAYQEEREAMYQELAAEANR